MREIETALNGWCPSVDEYVLYELWEAHRILPYAGGWLDQPLSIHRLFNNCGLWDEWLKLNQKLPSAKGLPKFGVVS